MNESKGGELIHRHIIYKKIKLLSLREVKLLIPRLDIWITNDVVNGFIRSFKNSIVVRQMSILKLLPVSSSVFSSSIGNVFFFPIYLALPFTLFLRTQKDNTNLKKDRQELSFHLWYTFSISMFLLSSVICFTK